MFLKPQTIAAVLFLVVLAAADIARSDDSLYKEAEQPIDKRVIKPGEFRVLVGTSSREVDLTELSLQVE